MSKAIQIKVPKPCHENWHSMTPKEQGRFCASCEKVVVDFSKMSDKELLHHLSKTAGQPVCGRFANDQLNREIKPPTINRRFSPAYVWNLLLATALFFESCDDTTTGELNVLEKPAVDTGKAANAVDTATSLQLPEEKEEERSKEKDATVFDSIALLPLPEGKEEMLSRDLKLSEDGWTTMGFSVMEKSDGEPVKGADGLPVWLKLNCFDKNK